MFTRLYVYACANWKLMLAVIILTALATVVIATQFQWIPQTTFVAINWDNGMIRRLP